VKRVILAGLKQETATFNPVLTRSDDFEIRRRSDLVLDLRNAQSEIAGAVRVFESASVEIVPTMIAWAVSGGPIESSSLETPVTEILRSVREAGPTDGALIVLHGAMAGVDEDDPEGLLLQEIRSILGSIPIVATLDLHAVLTDRMLEAADLLVPFHTYPHTDQVETGARAARNLLLLMNGAADPATARVPIPLLARGDELLTRGGRFGYAIDECRRIEASAAGLSAGILIGNPFTDVPDLQSNVIVTTDGDIDRAQREAELLARFMWANRSHFVVRLVALDEAIRIAAATSGLTVFSDAADATASGAPGDSNAILRALIEAGYPGRALISMVDAPAVETSFKAGVGQTFNLPLGGTYDPSRHLPIRLPVTVKSLTDGDFLYEDGTPANAGRTALLTCGKHHIAVTSRPVYVVDRSLFRACGQDPEEYDLVVVKSQNGFRTYYESIAERILCVDAPGATTANLRSLPYEKCVRPIVPLDDDVPAPPFTLQNAISA